MIKKTYQKPTMTVSELQPSGMLAGSDDLVFLGAELEGWSDDYEDAWDGTSPSGGGSNMGGWTDSGGSAWD